MYAKSENYHSRQPLSNVELQRLLPKVGDRRMEIPTIDESQNRGCIMAGRSPQPCVVIAVHPGHLWYTVQFENGFRECYKVPKVTTQHEYYKNRREAGQ